MSKWGVCALVCGALCLIFGVMILYVSIANPQPQWSMFFVFLIYGLLGTAGGICGIAGGLSINRDNEAARKLLGAASIIVLPYALVFFFLFMVARNRAADAEKVWDE